MQRLLPLLLVFLISEFSTAQLTLARVDSNEEVTGTTQYYEWPSSTYEFAASFMIYNSTDSIYSVSCRRSETSVEEGFGMKSSIAWVVHHYFVDVGEIPTRFGLFTVDLAPGDSVGFSLHLKPNDHAACSYYNVSFYNENIYDDVYASVDMVFNHSDGDCTTSVDEAQIIETSLSPNPSSSISELTITGLDKPVEIHILDLLGQAISKEQFNPIESEVLRIDSSVMSNGIYFISIQDEGQVLQTMKMVVKH